MIKKLVLNNYRVYDHKEIEFDPKLNVIKGANGIGKTTIVEAIAFALFGSSMQRGKAGSWIKHGEENGSVELYIDDYKITRANNLAIVEKNDEVVARNNTGITEWVETTYGLTPELYRTSFYIAQKEIGSFAALGPLERTKRVEKLLRIDKLDDIKQTARDKLRAVSMTYETAVSAVESNEYDEKFYQEQLKRLEHFEQAVEDLEKEYHEQSVAYGEYKEKYKQWLERQKFNGVVYDIDEVSRQNEINRLYEEKVKLEKKLANITILEKYFNDDISQYMIHKQNDERSKKLKEELDKATVEPKKYDIESIQEEYAELLKLYKLAVNTPETCPTCGQPWPEKLERSAEDIKAEMDKLQVSEKEEATRLWKIKEEMRSLEWDPNYEIAMQSILHKDDYLRLKELEDIEPVKTVDLSYAVEQNRLAEIPVVEEPEKIDLSKIKQQLEVTKGALESARHIVQEQEKAKAVLDEYLPLVEKYKDQRDTLKEFVKFIDTYRKNFGSNVIPLLQKTVSGIVAYLTDEKYEEIEINNDYSIAGYDYYSGSEQDAINFALRLAIAKISRIGKFNTMLLDEIAASFDAEKEKRLLDILQRQDIQLVYITHGDI